jgi:phosphatidylglycerophosphatase C
MENNLSPNTYKVPVAYRRENGPLPTLVLCDFDGTLTWRNSPPAFLLFAIGFWPILARVPLGLWYIVQSTLQGRWSKADMKAAMLRACFAGKKAEKLWNLSRAFTEQRLRRLVRPDMLKELHHFKAAGATVAVVSASLDLWLHYFCEDEGFILLCTGTEFGANGRFSGFTTPNCNHIEKARRVQTTFELDQHPYIIAYGNSAGDRAMLSLAHEAWFCRRGRFERII